MRAMPALHGRTVLASGDVDELTRVGAHIFSPHRLTYRGTVAHLDAVPVDAAVLASMRYRGDCTVATTEELGYYAVHLPLAGRGSVRFGREEISTAPDRHVVFNPADQPVMRWSADLHQWGVKVSVAALVAHLAALIGRPVDRPPVFTHGRDEGSSPGWPAVVRMMVGAAACSGGSSLPDRLAARLADAFLTALLLTQPHDWSHVLYAAAPAAPADAVAQAVERIEAQPALGWTTARLAADTGVSARTLQEGFRRAYDMTPTEYVREARLRRVHRDLTDPARAGESVTEIATAAGFTHLGRFAAAYRRRHGLHPSVVLRTTRTVAASS